MRAIKETFTCRAKCGQASVAQSQRRSLKLEERRKKVDEITQCTLRGRERECYIRGRQFQVLYTKLSGLHYYEWPSENFESVGEYTNTTGVANDQHRVQTIGEVEHARESGMDRYR
jgi:hypothetical protein